MLWKLLIVGAASYLALRRSAILRHPAVRAMLSPGRPSPPGEGGRSSRFNDRVFLVLLVTAATAVAALVLGRMWILHAGTAP